MCGHADFPDAKLAGISVPGKQSPACHQFTGNTEPHRNHRYETNRRGTSWTEPGSISCGKSGIDAIKHSCRQVSPKCYCERNGKSTYADTSETTCMPPASLLLYENRPFPRGSQAWSGNILRGSPWLARIVLADGVVFYLRSRLLKCHAMTGNRFSHAKKAIAPAGIQAGVPGIPGTPAFTRQIQIRLDPSGTSPTSLDVSRASWMPSI